MEFLDSVISVPDETNGGALTVTPAKLLEVIKCGWATDLDGMDNTFLTNALWSFDTATFPAGILLASTTFAYFDQGTQHWKLTNDDGSTTPRRCACQHGTNAHDWKVTAAADVFTNCGPACIAEFGVSYNFRVPQSAWENNFLKTAFATALSPVSGAFVNLQLDNSDVPTANGGAAWTSGWPNNAVTQFPFGEQDGLKTAATIVSGGVAGQLKTDITDLVADMALVTANRDAFKSGVALITDTADVLFNNWTVIQDVIDTVKNDTQLLFDAADAVIDVLDQCANIDSQYFLLKDALCNETVEGAAGIAMAAFFIGMVGILLIFTLGAMVKGCKLPKDLEEPSDEEPNMDDDYNEVASQPPPYSGKPTGQEWNQMQPVTRGYSAY